MRQILGIELEKAVAVAAPVVNLPTQTNAPDALAERMIQAESEDEEDHRHVDLPELIQMLDAQRVIGERGNHPDPQRQENADDSKTALMVLAAQAVLPQSIDENARCEDAAQPIVARNRQTEKRAGLQLEYLRRRENKCQIERGNPDGKAESAESGGVLLHFVKIKGEHQHRRNRKQIKNGTEQRVNQFADLRREHAARNQNGAERIEQVFLECADAEYHAGGKAPLIQLVFGVGGQNQEKDHPDKQCKNQKIAHGKGGKERTQAINPCRHCKNSFFYSNKPKI